MLGCLAFAGLSTGGWECGTPIYEYEQYKPGSSQPWQKFFFFKNVPRWLLCGSSAGTCLGVPDQFRVTAQQGEERDRYMFFGRTGRDLNSRCFDEDGDYLLGCSYVWWEPGRFGPEDEGTKDSGVFYPLGSENIVHWVRHYDRGACSVAWDDANILELRDAIVETFRHGLGDSWVIHSVDVESAFIWFLLGVPPSQRDDVDADNYDFVVVQADYRVKPNSSGEWRATIYLQWRFDVGSRSAYLYCGPGHDCDEDPYLPCVTDEDCTQYVHGAHCTQYATPENPGVCYKAPVLVIEDYQFGFLTRPDKWCKLDPGFCMTYYDRFVDALKKLQDDQYRRIFLPILNQINEGMWSPVPHVLLYDPGEYCTSDGDCARRAAVFGPNLDWKCDASPPNEEDYPEPYTCYVRPDHIWGVNEYPWTLEFVLVPADDNTRYPERALFSLDRLCDEEWNSKLSDVDHKWVYWRR